jgi:MFS family permease
MAIGPISVTVLLGLLAFGWRQVYLFWFFPLILGTIATLRIKAEPQKELQNPRELDEPPEETSTLLTANLVLFLVFVGIRMMANGMVSSFLTLFLVEVKGVADYWASLVLGGNYLMGLIAAPLGGFLAARYGEKKWLQVVLSLSYISLAVALFVPNTSLFIVLYLLNGFFNFLGMAANSSIMASLSPSRQRGLGYALFFLPGSIMGAVAPILAAFIAEVYGLTSIFSASIAIFFIGLAVLRFGVKLPK